MNILRRYTLYENIIRASAVGGGIVGGVSGYNYHRSCTGKHSRAEYVAESIARTTTYAVIGAACGGLYGILAPVTVPVTVIAGACSAYEYSTKTKNSSCT